VLHETVWRGVPAYTLETDQLRVVTTPDVGAKITSIYDKRANYEWLVAPPDRAFGPVSYGDVFVEQDMSGWDEMYPTIKPCSYPADGHYAGVTLPDHGEVWALPWRVEVAAGDSLTLSVDGRALPYRLRRTLAASIDGGAVLRYDVVNTGAVPIVALWAAHPQFTATTHTRIQLPDNVKELYNVRDIPAWGAWGLRYRWPEATNRQGTTVRMDHIAPASAMACRKLYVPPDTPIEWAALVEESSDHWLLMQWHASQIPYIGIWVDEGWANSVATVALEITDGFHDSLETAWDHKCCPIIAPGEQRQWTITVSVGEGPLNVA